MLKKIEDLCNKKGITFYKLSKETGISVQALSAFKRRPNASLSASNLAKIAEYFKVPMEYFLDKESD